MSDQLLSNKIFTIKGVLTDEEITFLERLSIIEPIPLETRDSGFCKVTVPRLEGHSTPAPGDNIDEGKPYQIKLPLAKESPAVLEFIGFTPATARELWSGFTRQESTPKPPKLMDYVYEHISLLQTPAFREMDRNKALMLLGLERGFEQALFNPQYSITLKLNSLYILVKHALGDRYDWIGIWQKKLKRRARYLIAGGKIDRVYRTSVFAYYSGFIRCDESRS